MYVLYYLFVCDMIRFYCHCKDGATALYIAAQEGHLPALQLLYQEYCKSRIL